MADYRRVRRLHSPHNYGHSDIRSTHIN